MGDKIMLNGFKNFQNNHFLVNISDEQSAELRTELAIEADERILLVIDDSLLANLKNIIVFTDKKMYWTMKNAIIKIKREDFFSIVRGSSSISIKELCTASVFEEKNGNNTYISIIGENIQISFTFRNYTNSDALKIVFLDYISNYCGGYNENRGKNEVLYKKIQKKNRSKPGFIISDCFEVCNAVGILFILVKVVLTLFLKKDIMEFVSCKQLIVLTLISKFFSSLFGSRKSVNLVLLMILVLSYIMLIPEFKVFVNTIYFLGMYVALNVIFSLLDFDRIFKIIMIVSAVLALTSLLFEVFNIATLIPYLK
jgi:hypothetical protein